MKKYILLIILYLLAHKAVLAAAPADLVNAHYNIYVGDVNNDSCPDYLLKPAGQIVTIPFDDDLVLTFPVIRNALPLMIVSNAGCKSFSSRTPEASELADGRWQRGDFYVASGDVLGNENGSLFVGPIASAGRYAFNLSRDATGQLTLIQTLPTASLFTTSTAVGYLENQNNDNRTDLVIRDGTSILAVFKANADGTFAPGGSDGVLVATAVWRGFMKALGSGDPTTSLSFVSKGIKSEVLAALTTPGADPSQFLKSIVRFNVLEVDPLWVRCAITFKLGGVDTFFFMLIGLDEDGVFRIAQF